MQQINFTEFEKLTSGDLNNQQFSTVQSLTDDILYPLLGSANGIIGNSFAPTYVSALAGSLAAGSGFFYDSSQTGFNPKYRLIKAASDIALVFGAANTQDRIDLVCLAPAFTVSSTASRFVKAGGTGPVALQTVNKVYSSGYTLSIVAGTPGATPAVPATPAGYIAITSYYIHANTGLASQSDVTDLRAAIYSPNVAQPVVVSFTGNGTWTAPAGVTSIQLTPGLNFNPMSPALVAPTMIALDCFGNALAWGSNTNGQLGNGASTTLSSPVMVLGGLTFRSINAGASVLAIASNGRLYGWGLNSSSEIGNGNSTPQSSPVLVAGNMTFQAVSGSSNAGSYTSYGITTAGALYAWGANNYYQLGNGNSTGSSTPTAVLSALTFKSVIAAANNNQGNSYALALSTAGACYAWGTNGGSGVLGNGITTYSSPVLVSGALVFQQIAAGNSGNNYGLTTAGVLWAWGANNFGELGVGNVSTQNSPALVLGGLTFQSVIPSTGPDGSEFCLGLTTSGACYAWGVNNSGQLGNGNTTSQSSPVLVLGGYTFQSIVTGGGSGFTCGLTTSGAAYYWGDGVNSTPVLIGGGYIFRSIAVCSSSNDFYGLTTSGQLVCWGTNATGELGVGTHASVPASSPVVVLGGGIFSTPPQLPAQNVAVVPGTTYTINLSAFLPTFGTTVLNTGPLTGLTLQYLP
jgi:alpha-tubulin suppressor-like RCC1 family protein